MLAAGILSLLLTLNGIAQTNSIKLSITTNYFAFSSPFSIGSNTLAEILTNVPDGTTVYRYTASNGFGSGATFIQGQGWFDNDDPSGTGGPATGPVLEPGSGAFIKNPGGPFSITLTGTPVAPTLPLSVNCGQYYLLGRLTNDFGNFETITGISPEDGAQVLIYHGDPSGFSFIDDFGPNDYDVYTFCGGAWIPQPPVLPPGQAAFIRQTCVSNGCITVSQPDIVVTSSTIVPVTYFPSYGDSCMAEATVYFRPNPGSYFLPGTTPVHCVVVDSRGSAGSVDFNVTVAPPPTPLPLGAYVINVNQGLNLIAYQFDLGGNTLREIMTNVPDGTVVSKFDNTNQIWIQSRYNAGLNAWFPPNIILRPGEGAFVQSPTNFPLIIQGTTNIPVLPLAITNSIVLVSRQANGPGTYANITGGSPSPGTTVYKWNGSSYSIFTFDGSSWSPSEPTNEIGEAWWISPGGQAGPPSVPLPPTVLQPPTPLSVPLGTTTNLFVAASGTAPLFYQWRINGNPISGATDSSLTLSNLQPAQCGNYDVLVYNVIATTPSDVAPVTLSDAASLPFTDDFANAGTLPSTTNGFGFSSNVGASADFDEISPGFIPGGASVWVKWQAPDTGVATFSTAGSSFDTLLAVYTGTEETNLTAIGFDDDSAGFLCSSVRFNAVVGTVYDIQADGFYGQTGSLGLSWDLQATASQLPVIVAYPRSQTVALGSSAAFSVTVDTNYVVSYQWLHDGSPVVGETNATLHLLAVTATNVGTYQVQVTNLNGGLSAITFPADLQVNSSDPGQPIFNNARAETKLEAVQDQTIRPDDPYDPTLVTGYTGTQIFSTFGSITQPVFPPQCGVPCSFTRWHTFTPPSDGLLVINNAGTTFNGVLAVYTGPDLSLLPLACSALHGPGAEVVSFGSAANTTYWIAVSSTNNGGTVQLNYSLLSPPSYTKLPISHTYSIGANVTLSVATTGNPPPTYQWQLNGTNIPGATSASLHLNPAGNPGLNFQDVNSGNYTVLAVNAAGANLFRYAPVFPNNPPREANTAIFGNQFFTQVMGLPNSNYVLQASSDQQTWTNVSSGSSSTGVINFFDTFNVSNAVQFYRAVMPPPIK